MLKSQAKRDEGREERIITRKIITNCYNPTHKRPRLESEKNYIYKPEKEMDWSYSHHPSISYFNGKFYAIWSNGKVNEDDLGQRVLLSSSLDSEEWTKPIPIVNTRIGKHSPVVLTAAGFYNSGNELLAYFGQYEYKKENIENGSFKRSATGHMDTSLYAITTKDGTNWSNPIPVGIPIVPNHGPQKTESGRLIISGNISFPYTDDPSGLSEWQISGIYPNDMESQIFDDSEGFWIVKNRMKWPYGLCEGSFYQTEDGIIHMLLRSVKNEKSRLWLTVSEDDGATWSQPIETDFTDNDTKFHFGKLQSGRYYYVGSPDPNGKRCPLVLSLSIDGVSFDQHFILEEKEYTPRMKGLHKSGVYGYPQSIIHDGCLYVICSICKEDIAVFRISCDTL